MPPKTTSNQSCNGSIILPLPIVYIGTMKRKSISKDHNPAIKGYLPIRISLPSTSTSSSNSKQQQEHSFTSFIYIKEHIQRSQGTNTNANSSGGGSDTLFISNAPSNGPIRTDLLLQSLFEVYGDIERVTVAQNPRKANLSSNIDDDETATEIFREAAISNLDVGNIFATHNKSEKGNGKFAHVVFTSSKEMKRALKLIKKEISDAASKNNGVFVMKLNDDRMEQLKLESQQIANQQQNREEEDSGDSHDEDEEDATNQLTGIQAIVAQARRTANRNISRSKLMQLCNEAMASYETQETLQEENAKRLAEEPDEDGFITVTSKSSTPSFGITNDLEEEVHARRGKGKRNRKRKGGSGADELTDFYRFQLKEQRKKEVTDLKQRFEEDLKKVKQMKEERKFRPF